MSGYPMTRRSAGFTVQNWPLTIYGKQKKTVDKPQDKAYIDNDGKRRKEKKMARKRSETVEVGAEFEARDGSICIAQFFKSSSLWNVFEIARKIIVSNVSGNPNGILESN